MKIFSTLVAITATLAFTASAQENETLCSKYTTALFTNNTADNQLGLVTALVNLAVLGNETQNVQGILAEDGGLAPYFTGALNTTNRNDMPTSVDFLDGASALPNPPEDSNTYILLSHLYQFFGALLGCNADDFPPYEGDPDMYRVHKFMNLTEEQNTYFIEQVGASATAFGVTEEDVTTVATVLDSMFNRRCLPEIESSDIDFLEGTLPSICQAPSCPLADDPVCPDDVVTQGTPTMAPEGGTVDAPSPPTTATETSGAAVVATLEAVIMTMPLLAAGAVMGMV